ncbi:hypothetical protein GCM10008014_15380 [Paenibacillus silvae]|uniref:Uncharacterized protein n=1 Tax=Paenibacillus silvae TaxID=1325358 RepID=A0ABQ1Z4W6_9BACL|nr:hypothetical protein [Paenibacillus silvae]GGH50335.1 hypothetical protein GCM10008014_15380 [Paenibacillus silvae]
MQDYADYIIENPDGEIYLEMAQAEAINYVLEITEGPPSGFISEKG